MTANIPLFPSLSSWTASHKSSIKSLGLIVFFTSRRAEEKRSMWEVLFLSINIGFLSALGIHFYIGYTDIIHVAPAITGYAIALLAPALTYGRCENQNSDQV